MCDLESLAQCLSPENLENFHLYGCFQHTGRRALPSGCQDPGKQVRQDVGLGELLALLQALPVEFPLEWGGEGKVCLFMERLLYAVSRPGAITKKPQNLIHIPRPRSQPVLQ